MSAGAILRFACTGGKYTNGRYGSQTAYAGSGDVRVFCGARSSGTAGFSLTRRNPTQREGTRASDRGTCARFAGSAPPGRGNTRARGAIPRSGKSRARQIGGRGRESAGRGLWDVAIRAHEAQSHATGRAARVKSGDVDENPRVAGRGSLLLRSFAP